MTSGTDIAAVMVPISTPVAELPYNDLSTVAFIGPRGNRTELSISAKIIWSFTRRIEITFTDGENVTAKSESIFPNR